MRFNPPSIDSQELEMVRNERQSDTWNEHTDRFEAVDRER